MSTLTKQSEALYAHVLGLREGVSRRAIIDEGMAPSSLVWLTSNMDDRLVQAFDGRTLARVWVERSDSHPLTLTPRWEWMG